MLEIRQGVKIRTKLNSTFFYLKSFCLDLSILFFVCSPLPLPSISIVNLKFSSLCGGQKVNIQRRNDFRPSTLLPFAVSHFVTSNYPFCVHIGFNIFVPISPSHCTFC